MSDVTSTSDSKTLVVIIHAWGGNAATMASVAEAVKSLIPNATAFLPDLPLGFASLQNLDRLAAAIIDRGPDHDRIRGADGRTIEDYRDFRDKQGYAPFDNIILVGHSLGGLLARKVYLLACGANNAPPSRQRESQGIPRPWADSITRIVLFSALNRGWSLNHHLPPAKALWAAFGMFLGEFIRTFFNVSAAAFQVRRGSAFITALRLQWLEVMTQRIFDKRPIPITVQLLGSIDDLVSPDDNVDLDTGQSFYYLDVPKSTHVNVVAFDDTKPGKARRDIFAQALLESAAQLDDRSLVPVDAEFQRAIPHVTDVIFVIHGIRDLGYWTHKVARRILAEAKASGRVFVSRTPTYGYFPMLAFILPWMRRRKVEWLMDQYVRARALYPDARFSYVGHSNGTYMLSSALEHYPKCQFDRVVFAGSVVNRRYDWDRVIKCGQVQAIANYVATADWVVAVLPGLFEQVPVQDLGAAGHLGFRFTSPVTATTAGLENLDYIKGDHSAALVEDNWTDIAKFIVTGVPQKPRVYTLTEQQSALIKWSYRLSPLIWLFGIFLAVLALLGICLLPVPEWLRTILVLAYLWLVWFVLTWF